MKLKLNETKIYVVYVSIFSLFLGFILNEDLSTGGSKMDFYHTWPLVINFSNNIFDSSHEFTRHFPFHYIILSVNRKKVVRGVGTYSFEVQDSKMWAILVNEVVNCANGDQGESIPVR